MAENIGIIYNTKIPSLADAADIQEALKLYHYGSITYNTNNTDPLALPNPSMARHLANIQGQINEILASGIGSVFVADQPVSPDNGFIWMDSDASSPSETIYPTSVYSNSPPTENLVNGIIWIDKDSDRKDVYVWNSSTMSWDKTSQSLSAGEFDENLIIMGVY